MKMNDQHPRYKEFAVKVCHENDAYKESSILKMILFKSKYKLRNHAVKHFLNTDEFENVWEKRLSKNISSLTRYTSDLKNMGCYSLANPPCNKCSIFEQCTPYVSEIENLYLKEIEDVIIKGGYLPRYVSFFSNWDKNGVFSSLLDNRVILKAGLLENDIFNLMTCYVKKGRSFAEIMNNEVSKILLEADNKSIKWCNKAKWAIGISIENKSKTKKKPPRSPYRCGGGANWQQQLAEMKDW